MAETVALYGALGVEVGTGVLVGGTRDKSVGEGCRVMVGASVAASVTSMKVGVLAKEVELPSLRSKSLKLFNFCHFLSGRTPRLTVGLPLARLLRLRKKRDKGRPYACRRLFGSYFFVTKDSHAVKNSRAPELRLSRFSSVSK